MIRLKVRKRRSNDRRYGLICFRMDLQYGDTRCTRRPSFSFCQWWSEPHESKSSGEQQTPLLFARQTPRDSHSEW